jgi:hypothetical protein
MSYGLGGACETASNNGTSTDGEYHQYLSHYNSSTRSHQQSRPYSNGFHDSLILNGHNGLNNIEDDQQHHHHQQQQQIDDDYEEMAPDRPKLLMWGLTKYKEKFVFLFNSVYIYLSNFLEAVKRRLLSLFSKK